MDTTEGKPEAGVGKRRVNSNIVAAGVAFGLTLAGLGVAAAQTEPDASTTVAAPPTTDSTASNDSNDESSDSAHAAHGVAETELTGDVAGR